MIAIEIKLTLFQKVDLGYNSMKMLNSPYMSTLERQGVYLTIYCIYISRFLMFSLLHHPLCFAWFSGLYMWFIESIQ